LTESLSDYTKLCQYAANKVSCSQFEREMASFMSETFNTTLRANLDDRSVYHIWE